MILTDEIQKKERMHALTLQRITSTCAAYKQELEEARKFIASALETKNVIQEMPFLDRHLNGLTGNYAEENIPVYIEMAQCGEGLWSTFVQHMGFPSWRTIQRWRKSMLDVHGISGELLDGSPEHLDKLFKGFFGENYQQQRQRVVLAVDAAGVNPHVIVHKDGTVDGFVDPDANMPVEEAMELRQSLDAFRQFVDSNKNNIVRDFFVVLACPLESRKGGFPIYLHPKGNGAADPNFVNKLLEVTQVVRRLEVDVIGLAFDGDTGYLKFARAISTDLTCVDFTKTLAQQQIGHMLMFEDLLHLVKCIRYRFVCGSTVCPYPQLPEGVSVADFEQIGIAPWVLDPSQVRKMDDFLPLMMFTIDNVCNALKMNREDVAVTLLPIALALDAVMNGNLTRIERLDYLATAWAFFWCYKQAYSIMPSEMKCQTSSKQKGMNRHMQIYDMNTLDKGLSLFYSLSVVISDAKPVHLGALGTHWLEHLFGNVRRLCNRNDTPENFQRCLLLTVFKKLVLTQGDGSCQPRKRLSDSGAFLDPEPTPSSSRMPLGSLVHEAGCLLKFNLATLPPQLGQCLHLSLRFPTRFRPGIPPIACLLKVPATKPDCGSTTASRMTSVAGLTTRKRDIMATQV